MGFAFAKVSQIFMMVSAIERGAIGGQEGLLLILRMRYAARSWRSALPVTGNAGKKPFPLRS